jgi:hypothetical protein
MSTAAKTYSNMRRVFEPLTNKTPLISHSWHKNNVLYSYANDTVILLQALKGMPSFSAISDVESGSDATASKIFLAVSLDPEFQRCIGYNLEKFISSLAVTKTKVYSFYSCFRHVTYIWATSA